MSFSRGEECERIFEGLLFDGLPSLIAAAHELKSPLALIRQLSLTLEYGNISSADQQRMLRQICLTSEKALRLTSDLTRSARLDDAMFKLEPINPHQLCKDIIHEIRPLFIAHDRDIKLVSNRHSLLLVANRDLLRRIMMNFSDNALHYAEKDQTVEIKVCSIDGGKKVRLGVRDYGPAVPSNVFKSLSNKLPCSLSAVHARPQSSGLGLYISGLFADAMNGEIGVTRHRDGATFYIDFSASRQLSLL